MKAILVVSFGTSYKENIQKTIGAVERRIAEAFPDYAMFRAFTSPTIRKKLWEKEQMQVFSPVEALKELKEKGYRKVWIQPTFLIRGIEYDKLKECVAGYKQQFERLELGTPLLYDDADIEEMSYCLSRLVTKLSGTKQADWIFMGHGTEHEADETYLKLQDALWRRGEDTIWIGTVEGAIGLSEIQDALNTRRYQEKNVVLHPLLLVAGDHANNDMAGEEEDSWKNLLKKDGFLVACVLRGLGEYRWIQELYVKKLQMLIKHKDIAE